MRRVWLVTLVVLSLIAAACGDDSDSDDGAAVGDGSDAVESDASDDGGSGSDSDDGGSDTDTNDDGDAATTDEPVELTASYRGVTEDSIKVGVAAIDFEALQAFAVEIDGFPSEIWAPAWAQAFNDRGGAHGRMMETVVSTFLPVGTEEVDATCAELTQDEEVFVVFGAMLGDSPLCVTELNETPYVGMFGLTDERLERSIAPFFASEMAADAQRENSLRALIDEGTFDGVKLGVWWEVADDPVAENVVLPLLDEAGVDVVETVVLGDFGDDTAASEASADTLFAALAGAQADMYLNISGLVSFNRAVDRNSPGVPFVLLNGQVTNSAIVSTSGYDPDVLADAIAVTAAKPTGAEWRENPGWQQCVAEIEAYDPESIDIDDIDDSVAEGIGQACQGFRLLEHLLVNADPNLTPEAMVEVADATGEFLLPGMAGGSLGPGKYSVGDAVRYYTYDPEQQIMVPEGDPIVVTG